MAISSEGCTPYLSLSLFKELSGKDTPPKELLAAIQDIAKKAAEKKSLEKLKFSTPTDPEKDIDGTSIAWTYYVEKRAPSWFSEGGLRDVRNHLIVVAKRGDLFAILFSDNGLRNAVVKKIDSAANGAASSIRRLSASDINKAFVEAQVRTLWLSGSHRRTTIKPDSKVLTGLELESSLDPLGDQSYFYSSVRSTMALSELQTGTVVGASPTSGRVWIGPSKSWDEFTTNLSLILDRASQKMGEERRTDKPIPTLAFATTDLSGIEQPYDIALIVPESIHDGTAELGEEDLQWLQQFGDAARFEIFPQQGSCDFEADVFWLDEKLGRISYEFDKSSSSIIRLRTKKISGFDAEERHSPILKICTKPENLTIYFDTGHTFARGYFYQTSFRDVPFEDWSWVRMDRDGTVFKQEKPLDGRRFAVENTGDKDDKSLFGLVARHWPDLDARSAQTGWLVCDDGAMESADFIHLDETANPPMLTLIHVKGSGVGDANRGLSVSDYEVVVGQAVKNLRHVDRGLLGQKLRANAEGVLKDAVWHNGLRQPNRDKFLDVLEQLGSNYKKKVVVFQPRVRRSVYNGIRGKMQQSANNESDIRRMQQLDALLLAARADCFSLGADFVVIADGDDLP